METFAVRTRQRSDMVDITREVAEIVRRSGIEHGHCVVFVPHTTAGVTINEHADPDVAADMIDVLDRIVPWNGPYRHMEGNTAAHVKASLTGSSATIIVENNSLRLGTWQGIFFCEYDGPRSRNVWVSLVATP
jgi:secondary thiamine-phosphate synthase enzyme